MWRVRIVCGSISVVDKGLKMLCATHYDSPVGGITICADGENIAGLWIDGQKYFGYAGATMTECNDLPVLVAAKGWLDRYFAGARPEISELPLSPRGGEFRQRVWRELCKIPYGCMTTYGEIARRVGCASAQAVGGAVGHNPISIIIPCHRIVGAAGSLTGYAGGIDKKIKLLEREGADISKLFVPRKSTAK